MAVEAAITGDPTLLYQACCYDPLCAAVLGLREIKQMVQEMLKKNKPYLPQFKNINIA
jgi:alpha-galactosidase